ncbi:Dabb family protein [Maribellus comscasis]|uniref:Dabb family protein n=1 Tax=Maribellus comscasis TaxID=2681766 RepID=A0A6I6JWC7_9BACT|nr:Dabb family protein [Maribellus comscasis]QGY45619.1 Dabb family protein [Maribellus comscasis]
MKNRRSFIKRGTAALALAGISGISKKAGAGEVKISSALLHHVFFWLKEPDNQAHRQQFESALEKLLKVETITVSHIGIPAATEERGVVDNSYTYSYLVMFDTLEDQLVYQTHPLHLKFIEENSDLWEKVVVYDSVDI